MPVDEMLSRMTSHELSEWLAFSQVEPIGEAREDFRTAMLASLTANINRDTEKRTEPFTAQDFIIDWWKYQAPVSEETDSWKANLQVAELITAALGGKDLREGRV